MFLCEVDLCTQELAKKMCLGPSSRENILIRFFYPAAPKSIKQL